MKNDYTENRESVGAKFCSNKFQFYEAYEIRLQMQECVDLKPKLLNFHSHNGNACPMMMLQMTQHLSKTV